MNKEIVETLRLRGTFRNDRHGIRAAREQLRHARGASADPLPPPKHLSAGAQMIWKRIIAEWFIDPAGAVILQTGLEAWDRLQQARSIIAKEGLVISGPRGPRSHPALRIEVQARTGVVAAFKALELEGPES